MDVVSEAETDQKLDNLQEQTTHLELCIQNLNVELEQKRRKVTELDAKKLQLATQISSLYRTVKIELKRKDNTITDLKQQIESILIKKQQFKNPPVEEHTQPWNNGTQSGFKLRSYHDANSVYSYRKRPYFYK